MYILPLEITLSKVEIEERESPVSAEFSERLTWKTTTHVLNLCVFRCWLAYN